MSALRPSTSAAARGSPRVSRSGLSAKIASHAFLRMPLFSMRYFVPTVVKKCRLESTKSTPGAPPGAQGTPQPLITWVFPSCLLVCLYLPRRPGRASVGAAAAPRDGRLGSKVRTVAGRGIQEPAGPARVDCAPPPPPPPPSSSSSSSPPHSLSRRKSLMLFLRGSGPM